MRGELKRKPLLLLTALCLPLLAFALPVLAALLIGPARADAVVAWLGRNSFRPHQHRVGVPVPPFALIDQQGRTVTRETLRGRVWVASFFLSRCAGPCPMTSAKMAGLQQRVADQDVTLVSFSMDPDRDTPEVLRGYAEQFAADPARWHMLTGDRGQILGVVDAFGLAARQGQAAAEMIHSDCFVLVDADGRARDYYDSGNPRHMDRLAAAAAALAPARELGAPSLTPT